MPKTDSEPSPTIRLLDAVTVGQIAAGEVIERPASVVKELVENAVDARAARVTVSVERGGADLVEVIDDGAGIAPEQLALAVTRHATSKLAAAADLHAIATLGFRGEGLASIAAVSELEIVSRTRDAPIGSRVTAHAEASSAVEPFAAPPGTRVRARHLFAEVPARREFLRSPGAEFARISGLLSTFALAYPRITFTLRHDGKDVWVMPASDDPRERLAMVFGRQAASALIPLAQADRTLGGSLSGFISTPGNDRPDRRLQLLFVNGRAVRGGAMAGAWSAGYATFTMLGRQPYGVLFLDLPPENIDANVHPTKSEVRFRYGAQVLDAVRRTIASTLREDAAQRLQDHAGSTGSVTFSAMASGVPAAVTLFENAGAIASENGDGGLRVLGQVDRTYIVATDGEALLLVDQHAAHERVAYEAIVAHVASEPLLVPYVVDLDATQSDALAHVLDALAEGGLEIESFGERSYRIVATPAGYGARAFDLAGFLDDLTDGRKQRDARERVWASLACHSVTVAGERLEMEEMATLVRRLGSCSNPMHCPHGRPTMVRLEPSEIARLFKR
ncbi:MAG TPA: DNA mismatch repair endonuclease MutL [Candidatus Dormibacteraeota bacterium]|nr:DNA mismatch repair endonuclease MutL [Candidatus Dormibacteraeota bacterium]